MPDNGAMVARVVAELAAAVDPGLAGWIDENVSFVTTMVDRITPRTTDDDLAGCAAATGVRRPGRRSSPSRSSSGCCPGEFPPAGPRWEAAGARFVDDIEPYETASCGCSTARTR